jgi:glycosyltransferase involved in cell wall biosynthesis
MAHASDAKRVIDTEAISAERTARQAVLTAPELVFDRQSVLHEEFADIGRKEPIIAVTHEEESVLHDLGFSNVMVIGHMRETAPTPRTFEQRNGMLFLGAIHDLASPNYDGLCWFIDSVLPLVEQSLKWETRLIVAGYVGDEVSLDRFRQHPRVTLLGTVPDVSHLYNANRLFVAPTRFAAGVPYKVHEAASYGLPVVATSLLCDQLGWQPGTDLLVAETNDARQFADLIITLYRDAPLWQRLRDNALTRVRSENSPESYSLAIDGAIERARSGV